MSETPSKVPDALKPLFELATRARANSHSPYSQFKVGAAMKLKNGMLYAGCNVENSTYGATVCAERSAISNAVTQEGGGIEPVELLVITETSPPSPPCGICRQVLAEFTREMTVHLANPQGEIRSFTLSQLLPEAFTPDHLSDR